MPTLQHAITTNLEKYQWYTHLSRTDGADLGVIKQAMRDARAAGSNTGVTAVVNVCLLFGPSFLADLTGVNAFCNIFRTVFCWYVTPRAATAPAR